MKTKSKEKLSVESSTRNSVFYIYDEDKENNGVINLRVPVRDEVEELEEVIEDENKENNEGSNLRVAVKDEVEEMEEVMNDEDKGNVGGSKLRQAVKDEVKEMKEVIEDEKKAEGAQSTKKVYSKIDPKKKLELATHCRDFEVEFNKTAKFKDLRKFFP